MPEVVQTGASVAIDFLSGFGRGMVQNDINRRENEKLNIQKSKWKAEMSALAAEDEFRKLQSENSRLEIDMRKTQFDDVVATREQTKGFVGFMADAVGKATGDPATKQANLLEAYTMGATQFPQADMSFGDKLIDAYAKIRETKSASKAWEYEDRKDLDTGTKSRFLIDEHGGVIREVAGSKENLEVVNDTVAKAHEEWDKEFDRRMQVVIAGRQAVVGSESGMSGIEDFMKKTGTDDDKTQQQRAIAYMYSVTDQINAEMEEKMGTFDAYLNQRLIPIMRDPKVRSDFTSAYKGHKQDVNAILALVDEKPAGERVEILATLLQEAEQTLAPHERLEIMGLLYKLQNAAELEFKEEQTVEAENSLAEAIAAAEARKDEILLKKYMEIHHPEGLGWRQNTANAWNNFLGKPQRAVLFGGETDASMLKKAKLAASEEPLVESFF